MTLIQISLLGMLILGIIGIGVMSYLIFIWKKKSQKNVSSREFRIVNQTKGLKSIWDSFVWWILIFALFAFALTFITGTALLIAGTK